MSNTDQPNFRPPPFGISVHLADQLAVSQVGGELDMATAPQVTATLKPLHSRMTAVVFEVSEVSFIDIAGLRDLWFAMSDTGTGVSFRNPSKVVRRLLGLIDRTDLIEDSDLSATAIGASRAEHPEKN